MRQTYDKWKKNYLHLNARYTLYSVIATPCWITGLLHCIIIIANLASDLSQVGLQLHCTVVDLWMDLLGPGPGPMAFGGPLALIMQFLGTAIKQTWWKSKCKTRHLSLLVILPSKVALFDRPYITFYWLAIVSIALSCKPYRFRVIFDVE